MEARASAAASSMPDYQRQLDVFDPAKFSTPVHIIGAGAIGSRIAADLSDLGVFNMTLWDHDRVKSHNLPNQRYGREEIGMLKTEAMAKIISRDCGFDVNIHAEKVMDQKLSGIVFVCVDKMRYRRQIWDNCLKYKMDVDLAVEIRMGAEFGMIYTVRPCYPIDVDGYENTLYNDDEVEPSACTYRAIPTVAGMVASTAAHKVVKFATGLQFSGKIKFEEGGEVQHTSAEILSINPVLVSRGEWIEETAASVV